MRISLALVVWNELEGCRIDVPHLPRDAFDEIYAIDGGSTDGTIAYLEAQGITVHRQPKRGLNAAYVHANRVSTADAVVVYFPKGTTPVGDLLRFRPLFEAGNDLVVASRQIAGSVNEEDGGLIRPRKWLVRALSVLAALVWKHEGYRIRDVLHGFKGWMRPAFARMHVLEHGLSIDIEMVVRSYKLRMRRTEFPTREIARAHGQTHFRIWPTGKKLLAYLWFEWRRDEPRVAAHDATVGEPETR
jgi:glycosyltransferase involved in cell wall biosynthesis